jgi:hypothetical protein
MSAAEQRTKSAAMAADLVRRGIWHGRRMTKPCHANYPNQNEIGSAAYRRIDRTRKSQSGMAAEVFVATAANLESLARRFNAPITRTWSIGESPTFTILRFTSRGIKKTVISAGTKFFVHANGRVKVI